MNNLPAEQLRKIACSENTFLFFDSAAPDKNNRYSYLFIKPKKVLSADDSASLKTLLKKLDSLSARFWICGYLNYEAGYHLDEHFFSFIVKEPSKQKHLGWFALFNKPFIFDHKKGKWVDFPLDKHKIINTVVSKNNIEISPAINMAEYKKNIRKIKSYISAGDTYQVNYTFDLSIKCNDDPYDLYLRLKKNQPTNYCAFIKHDSEHILSFSPELFFKKTGSKIATKPMKGTVKRGLTYVNDFENNTFLKSSVKNHAENIMIVDLLRNDLGKICGTGSIKVKKLCEIETYPSVTQMTSTITGTLRKNTFFADIIRNLFPCGSVTGAPKIRTMEIIKELEKGDRGVYCGMLGFSSPKHKAVFSVPIRVLQKKKTQKNWRFRVGSGIVWDSQSNDEWDECLTKSDFLKAAYPSDFELFESILWNKKPVFLRYHYSRLLNSAKYFNFPLSEKLFNRTIRSMNTFLTDKSNIKVRIFLDKHGTIRWDHSVLKNTFCDKTPNILLSKDIVDEKDVFLFHKTTQRPWYEKAAFNIQANKCFDVIFTNSKKQITEGSISNIFVKCGRKLFTPPISCGLLPGILRQKLISEGKCEEKTLYLDDVLNADALYCGNSVRGLQEVKLTTD